MFRDFAVIWERSSLRKIIAAKTPMDHSSRCHHLTPNLIHTRPRFMINVSIWKRWKSPGKGLNATALFNYSLHWRGESSIKLALCYRLKHCDTRNVSVYCLLEQQKSHKYLHIINHEENEFQMWKIAAKMKQLCKLFLNCPVLSAFFRFPAKVIASNAIT